MLNELYDLSVVLEKAGITPRDWHGNFILLPKTTLKKPCYKILLSSGSSITRIEPMKEGVAEHLRKWEPSNGNSFPGFNIQPLYRIVNEDRKKCLKKWREGKEPVDVMELKNWCSETQSRNWDAKIAKKLTKCLWEIPDQLRRQCGEVPESFLSVKKLFERICVWKDDTAIFFQELESCILSTIEKGKNIYSLLPVLIHEGSLNKKPEDDRGSISVFLDVPDWEEFPVANEKTIEWINMRLLQNHAPISIEANNQLDDAFGFESNESDVKLPDVKLPFIGKVKLRAMNSESLCQYRYGTVDAKSFRIGAYSRKRVKGALEWLGSDEREEATWGRVGKKELIFAYPVVLPKIPLKLAAFLGARKAEDSESRFEKYAEDVLKNLKELSISRKDIELRIFSLRKMDDTSAKTKVVFHRNYSAQRLEDAAKKWQQGCSNIPSVRIKAWGKEKGEIVLSNTKTPFPLQIAECLNRVWKQDGTTQYEVKTVLKSDGIELLLDENAIQHIVPHLMTVALQNGTELFLSMGNSLHLNDVFKLDGFNKHKQLMPPILGLLLWKLGIEKETYMNNPPYLVGRLLKLADDLHALYCKEVRNNSLPSQLLGNALMVAALNSPIQALAQLALRISPYLGWARTNKTESAGLSRYMLREFGLIEGELRDTTLPTRLDDPGRAQLLLGYISSNAQTEDPKNN